MMVSARVYPRVCGGTLPDATVPDSEPGLSPRVRGNQGPGNAKLDAIGSIPACAGEPHHRPQLRARTWVYPRVCGGTCNSPVSMMCGSGLSPRVRGNRNDLSRCEIAEGSIPACAGEPSKPVIVADQEWVYPRVCGGTCLPRCCLRELMGLSPRVRGNHSRSLAVFNSLGSIPACAGEPRSNLRRWRTDRVYPRVCGGTPTR